MISTKVIWKHTVKYLVVLKSYPKASLCKIITVRYIFSQNVHFLCMLIMKNVLLLKCQLITKSVQKSNWNAWVKIYLLTLTNGFLPEALFFQTLSHKKCFHCKERLWIILFMLLFDCMDFQEPWVKKYDWHSLTGKQMKTKEVC